MCNAFSCLVNQKCEVTWEFGTDSHEDLIKKAKYKDDTDDPELMRFARCEISPRNGNYLRPDKWEFKVDEEIRPRWLAYEQEKACWKAFREWKKMLYSVLIRKKVINPFEVKPKRITKRVKLLLKE